MCSRAYREEFPCDLPYLQNESRECKILAEDFILEHGPSRIIYSTFVALVSVLSLCVSLGKLRLLLIQQESTQGKQSFGNVIDKPGIKIYSFCILYSVLSCIMSIDVLGKCPFGLLFFKTTSHHFSMNMLGYGNRINIKLIDFIFGLMHFFGLGVIVFVTTALLRVLNLTSVPFVVEIRNTEACILAILFVTNAIAFPMAYYYVRPLYFL